MEVFETAVETPKKREVAGDALETGSPTKKQLKASTSNVDSPVPPKQYERCDLTLEKLEEIKNDLQELRVFQYHLEEYAHPLSAVEKVLLSYVNHCIAKLQEDGDPAVVAAGELRIASIEFNIKETNMTFWRDYEVFQQRVEHLFGWYHGDSEKYLAPYFCMVQSSGMGKTKLMYEFRNHHKKRKVILVVCGDPHVDHSEKLKGGVFNAVLTVQNIPGNKIKLLMEERLRIIQELEAFVKMAESGVEVVLLLDEAQFLIKWNDAFAFRVIRCWLRRNLTARHVVVVFAGTDSNLLNFLQEDDPILSNFPRGSKKAYNTGKGLYPPFYELSTIGLDKDKWADDETKSDFDRAIKFGRPLFAHMAAENKLNKESLDGILGRILLGENVTKDLTQACCLSVLGTRVQMGQTTLKVSSELVARGYACLTHVSSSSNLAKICFFPDPVCAWLSMNMMHVIKKNEIFGAGREPMFWTEKATQIFSTGLCRPNKGDVGEIASALFLLFCGDVLRASRDDTKAFVVPLCDVMLLAAKPSYQPPRSPEVSSASKASVSFIQICRSYLRHTVKELSSRKNKYLKEWFTAGCAFYAYPYCRKYDIIAPIRFAKDSGCSYHPMLISVKNQLVYGPTKRKIAVDDMEKILLSTEDKVGVCVLLLIGLPSKRVVLDSSPDFNTSEIGTITPPDVDTCETILDKFQKWKGDDIMKLIIVVPEDDCFGCWNMAVQDTLEGSEQSEVYASHLSVHQTAQTEESIEQAAERLMRSNSTSTDVLEEYLSRYASRDTCKRWT